MPAKKTLKTSFGVVDRQAFEELQESDYDTYALLDAIDQVRYCDEELRQDMLALHGMAHSLIDGAVNLGSKREESIGELAWDLMDKLYDCIKELEKVVEAVEPLTPLLADPDDERADAELETVDG